MAVRRQGALERAVRASGRQRGLRADDKAALELALTYARRIDSAEDLSYRTALMLAKLAGVDEDLAEEVDRLRAEYSAADTVATFGPKMLASLDALTLTPRARAAVGRGGAGGGRRGDAVDEIRNRRERRQHGAAVVDASSS